METCCGVRYGLPPRHAGVLGWHLHSRGPVLSARPHSHSPLNGGRPPPHRNRSRFGLRVRRARRSAGGGAHNAAPLVIILIGCFSFRLWFGWYRRGFTLSTFSRAGGSARDTKRLFARCSTANRWRSQQRGLLPTDHNLTYGCYGQRPPLKVNELGGLQQPKKEKKALPRATAGVGERVRLLPSTHTGLRTTDYYLDSKGGPPARWPRTLSGSGGRGRPRRRSSDPSTRPPSGEGETSSRLPHKGGAYSEKRRGGRRFGGLRAFIVLPPGEGGRGIGRDRRGRQKSAVARGDTHSFQRKPSHRRGAGGGSS